MAIDGCNRSFIDLAQNVLPNYMANLRIAMKRPKPLSEFVEIGVGPTILYRRYGLQNDPMGCYVFIDKKKPIYVGISKHIIQRIMEHIRQGDQYTCVSTESCGRPNYSQPFKVNKMR